MSDVWLGMTPPEDADRDATHVATVPMIADEDMRPGAHCGIISEGRAGPSAKPIGIVDPFLPKSVKAGERFYLCLYPRSVTGLRHHYLHPALDGDSRKTSMKAIDDIADDLGVDRDELLSHADSWVASKRDDGWGSYWVDGGRFEGVYLPDDFWPHYEIVRNTKVDKEHRGNFFSCSC